jgi:hypothetical protein
MKGIIRKYFDSKNERINEAILKKLGFNLEEPIDS